MKNITLTANAKINLTLDITGRRPDGYHTVETIMQSVTLADTVGLTVTGKTDTIGLTCDDPSVPLGEANLAYRAAEIFFAVTGTPNPGITIHIVKRIPAAAGLAGGSTDAAAVFFGLNRLLGTGLSIAALQKMALSLGVDIPFCLCGGTMLASGIGEQLTPLPPLPDCPIVIVKPEASVSTAAAYAAFDRLAAVRHPDAAATRKAVECGDLTDVADGMHNVLEAASGLTVIDQIKQDIRRFGALGACMSGSGSAVFGIFAGEAAAGACRAHFTDQSYRAYICRPAHVGCLIKDVSDG